MSYSQIKQFILCWILIIPLLSQGQSIEYAKSIIDTLCSPYFAGRGYNQQQDKKVAVYISNQFKQHQLNSFNTKFTQPFPISVNTITKSLHCVIDNKTLTPGIDFFISGNSTTCKGSFKIEWIPLETFTDFRTIQALKKNNYKNKFIGINLMSLKKDSLKNALLSLIRTQNILHAKGCIFIQTDTIKSWETIAGYQQPVSYPIIDINPNVINGNAKSIDIEVHSTYLQNYQTQNIIGYIPGMIQDTFIVFSAHYDHLGSLGETTYFPGAHDNASGVAMMLDIAREIKLLKLKPHYSICFMAFSAEEIGLIGSSFYCYQPLFPLTQIKQLINLDIIGTGSKGIMIENYESEPRNFSFLNEINNTQHFVPSIQARKNAPNSDHYPFSLHHVPAFFIYTLGNEYNAYHSINDKASALPLTTYEGLFKLIMTFIKLN